MTIVLHSMGFEWPNGTAVFNNLVLTLAPGRKYGLVGPNGVGKSTLAQLLLGELQPTSGSVRCEVQTAAFAQWQSPPLGCVADYLDDLWSQLAPPDAVLAGTLLARIDPLACCASLSGGEWTRVRLAQLLASAADFLILDEPSNNLDREGRAAVQVFVRGTTKGLLVISHDRELLQYVDAMLELSNQGLTAYGGNWNFYQAARERERARQQQELDRLRDERDKERREQRAKLEQQQKRMQRGQRDAADGGLPKILLGARKRQAQQTLGKLHSDSVQQLDAGVLAARVAWQQLKVDPVIAAGFADTTLPATKLVLQAEAFNFRFTGAADKLWQHDLTLSLHGPQRLCVRGANGSGKSTLLRLLMQREPPASERFGSLRLGSVAAALLDQGLLLLDPQLSVFDNVRVSSGKDRVALHNGLAQWLFAGAASEQPVATLSGGERLRAALAKLVLADPVPQLLILDEPTNNLDLPNLELLEEALRQFRAALIVVSHDDSILQRIEVADELVLG